MLNLICIELHLQSDIHIMCLGIICPITCLQKFIWKIRLGFPHPQGDGASASHPVKANVHFTSPRPASRLSHWATRTSQLYILGRVWRLVLTLSAVSIRLKTTFGRSLNKMLCFQSRVETLYVSFVEFDSAKDTILNTTNVKNLAIDRHSALFVCPKSYPYSAVLSLDSGPQSISRSVLRSDLLLNGHGSFLQRI